MPLALSVKSHKPGIKTGPHVLHHFALVNAFSQSRSRQGRRHIWRPPGYLLGGRASFLGTCSWQG